MSENRKDLSDRLQIDRLYLIAQFFCDTQTEAADLVEKTLTGTVPAGISEQIEKLVSLAEVNPTGPLDRTVLKEEPHLPLPEIQVSRVLQQKIEAYFFGLTPANRLSIWAGNTGLIDLPGPVDTLRDHLTRSCSPTELQLYGRFLTNAVIRKELNKFWESNFGTVPPSLRSVLESKARRSLVTVDSTPAAHPSAAKTKRTSPGTYRRAVIYLILIIATGFLGYTINQQSRSRRVQDVKKGIIEEISRSATDIMPDLHTRDSAQAERYIRDSFSRRVRIPTLTGLVLEGVGKKTFRDSIRVPVLIFQSDASDSLTPVFALSYDIVLSLDTQLSLPAGTLLQIENSEAVDIQISATGNAVIWRVADDIFIAVPPEEPAQFARRRMTGQG